MQHSTRIDKVRKEIGKGKGRLRYRASCCCGWGSQWQDTEEQAENEATDHIVYCADIE